MRKHHCNGGVVQRYAAHLLFGVFIICCSAKTSTTTIVEAFSGVAPIKTHYRTSLSNNINPLLKAQISVRNHHHQQQQQLKPSSLLSSVRFNSHKKTRSSASSAVVLFSSPTSNEEENNDDKYFDAKTTISLVGGQSLLIVISILIATLVGTPNYGLGPNFAFSWNAVGIGCLLTLPMGLLSVALDKIEDKYESLQEVTKATQRSVMTLLGGSWKPGVALLTSTILGCVAGLGEEMLFRGILQYELVSRFLTTLPGFDIIAVLLSSIIFGLLHAVTPLYAILATIASIYFGLIYIWFGNLLIPIVCHGVYDLAALMYAHWTVSQMSNEAKAQLILEWDGPSSTTTLPPPLPLSSTTTEESK